MQYLHTHMRCLHVDLIFYPCSCASPYPLLIQIVNPLPSPFWGSGTCALWLCRLCGFPSPLEA
jgi:hypothetical protein